MAYELVYTKHAVKDIRRLDHKVKERLKKALEKFKKAPFEESVKKLSHPELGTYRLRIGDYRVIFDVDWLFCVLDIEKIFIAVFE